MVPLPRYRHNTNVPTRLLIYVPTLTITLLFHVNTLPPPDEVMRLDIFLERERCYF